MERNVRDGETTRFHITEPSQGPVPTRRAVYPDHPSSGGGGGYGSGGDSSAAQHVEPPKALTQDQWPDGVPSGTASTSGPPIQRTLPL